MYERLNRTADNAVADRITSPLSRDEMSMITMEPEGLIDLQAFPYADLKSLWEDRKFDVRYAKDLERLALVGGGELEKWGTMLFGTLTFTRSRCFADGQCDAAWSWLAED